MIPSPLVAHHVRDARLNCVEDRDARSSPVDDVLHSPADFPAHRVFDITKYRSPDFEIRRYELVYLKFLPKSKIIR
jgi:hypothetical protein